MRKAERMGRSNGCNYERSPSYREQRALASSKSFFSLPEETQRIDRVAGDFKAVAALKRQRFPGISIRDARMDQINGTERRTELLKPVVMRKVLLTTVEGISREGEWVAWPWGSGGV